MESGEKVARDEAYVRISNMHARANTVRSTVYGMYIFMFFLDVLENFT